MTKRLLVLGVLLVCSAAFVFAAGSREPAEADADRVYRMSISYGGAEGSEEDTTAKEFKRMVEERSNGRLDITLYGYEQLGKEVDIVNMLELANVEMAIMGTTVHQQGAPRYNIWSAYYLFNSGDEVMHVLNGPIGERMEQEMLDNKEIRIIGYGLRGPRHLTSNRPIRTPEDVRGLNIRIPLQPIYVAAWETLGAYPEAIAYGELYSALAQGLVEAQENPLAYIYAPHFYEVQDYVNLTAHQRAFFTYVVSERFFQRLPRDLQQILLEAGEEITEFHNQLQADGEAEFQRRLEAEGMTFVEVDQEAFMDALKDIPRQFADQWEPGLYDDLLAELAEIRR